MEKAFTKVNGQVKELKVEMDRQKAKIERLKIEVSATKEIDIAEFKESNTYKDKPALLLYSWLKKG